MNHLTYCIIIACSFSLAFPKEKPCCNKKAKNTVSCKFNHTAIAKEKNIADQLTSKNEKSIPSSSNQIELETACAKEYGKKPWWKFWVKRAVCPCKAEASNTSNE